jgi:purine-binding chemotaxis protein CheW
MDMTTQTQSETRSEQQLVVFTLGSESYGAEISTVREIIRMQEVTTMPNSPEYVVGVINLRGKVIPVIDLRRKFGMESVEATKDTRIVVVDIGNQDIGVVVDGVNAVLRVPMESIDERSAVEHAQAPQYLTGIAKVDERLFILLDLDVMLTETNLGGETESDPSTTGD